METFKQEKIRLTYESKQYPCDDGDSCMFCANPSECPNKD